MTSKLPPTVMRANRLLGASLVDHNLVKLEDLEQANGRLLEVIASEQTRQMTVLGILAYEIEGREGKRTCSSTSWTTRGSVLSICATTRCTMSSERPLT